MHTTATITPSQNRVSLKRKAMPGQPAVESKLRQPQQVSTESSEGCTRDVPAISVDSGNDECWVDYENTLPAIDPIDSPDSKRRKTKQAKVTATCYLY
jgi:hypothetical protein